MTEQEAQALALLVGGIALDGKVYITSPKIDAGRRCTGCAFAIDGRIPPLTHPWSYAGCMSFLSCDGVIHVELKT